MTKITNNLPDRDFLEGPVVKSLLANEGNMSSVRVQKIQCI